MTHHKSNHAVEGDSDRGRSRGMPRRPDQDGLAERTEQDRREAGLPGTPPEDVDAAYEEEWRELDRETRAGELQTGTVRKRDRAPYPPSRYGD
ncbi:hypothetical protein [Streptomyces brasiliensis]|uniref:Uncharacterized protein n=1 Tax=Streptomyces brasiliensis TaxID=1954 RepID=A0A917K9D9_9ACTN|nr:hypothetical protein [Streptomyces brasiliensis]GGJ03159.1 hypothetical protein GCM10010121_011890 [Streptomyces brasiliensis]